MEENNLNNYQQSNKQNNTGMVVLVTVLVMLVIGLTGFIVYDKFISKDDTNESTSTTETNNTNSNKKVELSIDDPTVQKLYGIFKYGNNCNLGQKNEALNNSNLIRLGFAFQQLLESDKKTVSCSDLELETNGGYCGLQFNDTMYKYFGNDEEKFKEAIKLNTTIVVEESKLKAKYEELFGSNYQYVADDFDFGATKSEDSKCSPYHYIKGKALYAKYTGECGGVCGTQTQKITSAYKENDRLYINTTLEKTVDTVKIVSVNYEFKLENGRYTFVKVVEQ